MNRRAFINGNSLEIISKIDDLTPDVALFHVFNIDKKEYVTIRSDSMIITDNSVFTLKPKVLETVFAVLNLDRETWTIDSQEANGDWEHLYYDWVKGYSIDADGNVNVNALNTREQTFFFEPNTNTWLYFKEGMPCKYDTKQFYEEEKFMFLDLLDIPKPLKDKLSDLAKIITNSPLAKEELAKSYYR